MPNVIPAAGLSLVTSYETGFTLDHPIIGWKNLATSASADSADANYPASNLINPATHLRWQAAAAASSINIALTFVAQDIDYVAIARHNLGSTATPITIAYQDSASPPNLVTLFSSITLPDDGPALFRFSTITAATGIKITLAAPAAVPAIAVAYVGKLLVMPRKLYQGLTPINYGRVAKVTNGKSEAGQFLGRIVMQRFVQDTVPFSLIDPAYYLAHIDQFLSLSKEQPFFIAYRPQSHPESLGYCLMTNDPMPVNEAPHGLIAMQMEMTGII
jgi:hypothetical protein